MPPPIAGVPREAPTAATSDSSELSPLLREGSSRATTAAHCRTSRTTSMSSVSGGARVATACHFISTHSTPTAAALARAAAPRGDRYPGGRHHHGVRCAIDARRFRSASSARWRSSSHCLGGSGGDCAASGRSSKEAPAAKRAAISARSRLGRRRPAAAAAAAPPTDGWSVGGGASPPRGAASARRHRHAPHVTHPPPECLSARC